MEPIRWLHLSDMHFGAPGPEILNEVMNEFWEWLDRGQGVVQESIDLLLISGDVAYSGGGNPDKTNEYTLADKFLDKLCGKLGDPAVICVPGNHDLTRPYKLDERLRCAVFDDYAQRTGNRKHREYLDQDLWAPGAKASAVKPLFESYLGWANKWTDKLKSRDGIQEVHSSHFPGDLCVTLNLKDRFPLVIVGLNSAWLQYSSDEFKDRLAIPLRQFHAALPGDATSNPLDIFQTHPRAILMMHHPPSWLSEDACSTFYEEIFRPDRFDLCLYGHMHGPRATVRRIDGGREWVEFQSPSLCGLEHYGQQDESRSFGFTIGSLTHDGEIRVWPYIRTTQGGQPCFLPDSRFPMDGNEGARIREKNAPLSLHQAVPVGSSVRAPRQAFEGVLLGCAVTDAHPEYDRMIATARNIAPTLRIELISGRKTGEFVFFIHRGDDQAWSTLLQQVLKIAARIAVEQPTAMVLHIEHEANRPVQPGSLIGDEIIYTGGISSRLCRSQIVLTGEVYGHLRRFLSDSQAADKLLAVLPKNHASLT